MPCYSPKVCYRGSTLTKKGKRAVVFSMHSAGSSDFEILQVPCGRCIGCRLDKSRDWAVRCVHEAQMHDNNCFITLTYNSESLPEGSSLDKRDFQLFMKRLRKMFKGRVIRYFMSGQYGEQCGSCGSSKRFCCCGNYVKKLGRPHIHACLFNLDFPDREYLYTTDQGDDIYRSAMLESLWTKGFSSVANVTFKSAAYIARYVVRRWYGADADKHYKGRVPEYCCMSRGNNFAEGDPRKTFGLGHEWFMRYYRDVYPDDFILVGDGLKVKPPVYYDRLYELMCPDEYAIIKVKRKEVAENNPNSSKGRLMSRYQVKLCQSKMLRSKL